MLYFRWIIILGFITLSIYLSLSNLEYYSKFHNKELEQLDEEFVKSEESEIIKNLYIFIEELKLKDNFFGKDIISFQEILDNYIEGLNREDIPKFKFNTLEDLNQFVVSLEDTLLQSKKFETMKDLDNYIEELKQWSVPLGIDLQGGMRMEAELDLIDLFVNLTNSEYKNNFKATNDFRKILSYIRSNSNSKDFIDELFNFYESNDGYDIEDLNDYYSDLIINDVILSKKIFEDKLDIRLRSAKEIISSRIEELKVESKTKTKQPNRIIIEIAGFKEKDKGRIKEITKNTGSIEFILLKDRTDSWSKILNKMDGYYNFSELINFNSNTSITHSILVPNYNKNKINTIINNQEIQDLLNKSQFLWGIENKDKLGFTSLFYLNRYIELTGDEINNPKAVQYPMDDPRSGEWYISLEFENADSFEELTSDNRGKFLAIVLDNKVRMAPQINRKIDTGNAQITGNFTREEAKDIEIVLSSGELPAKTNILYEKYVTPTLAKEAVQAGKNSILIAICLVLGFMLFYYKGFGLVANIAMILNVPFIISIISTPAFKDYDVVNLTLAGIFGLVLTIGMAIDANVIIFERIKEEFLNGKKALDAIENGYKKAFRTILDSNITTLLAATALFAFGGELTRNFGLMLIVGLICSMFTSIFITKTIIMTYFKIRPFKKLSI